MLPTANSSTGFAYADSRASYSREHVDQIRTSGLNDHLPAHMEFHGGKSTSSYPNMRKGGSALFRTNSLWSTFWNRFLTRILFPVKWFTYSLTQTESVWAKLGFMVAGVVSAFFLLNQFYHILSFVVWFLSSSAETIWGPNNHAYVPYSVTNGGYSGSRIPFDPTLIDRYDHFRHTSLKLIGQAESSEGKLRRYWDFYFDRRGFRWDPYMESHVAPLIREDMVWEQDLKKLKRHISRWGPNAADITLEEHLAAKPQTGLLLAGSAPSPPSPSQLSNSPSNKDTRIPLCLVAHWDEGPLPEHAKLLMDSIEANKGFAHLLLLASNPSELAKHPSNHMKKVKASKRDKALRDSLPDPSQYDHVTAMNIGDIHSSYRYRGMAGLYADGLCKWFARFGARANGDPLGSHEGTSNGADDRIQLPLINDSQASKARQACLRLEEAIRNHDKAATDAGSHSVVDLLLPHIPTVLHRWINPSRCAAWGWIGDISMVFGDMKRWLDNDDILGWADVMTFSDGDLWRIYLRSSLTIHSWRNVTEIHAFPGAGILDKVVASAVPGQSTELWRLCPELSSMEKVTALMEKPATYPNVVEGCYSHHLITRPGTRTLVLPWSLNPHWESATLAVQFDGHLRICKGEKNKEECRKMINWEMRELKKKATKRPQGVKFLKDVLSGPNRSPHRVIDMPVKVYGGLHVEDDNKEVGNTDAGNLAAALKQSPELSKIISEKVVANRLPPVRTQHVKSNVPADPAIPAKDVSQADSSSVAAKNVSSAPKPKLSAASSNNTSPSVASPIKEDSQREGSARAVGIKDTEKSKIANQPLRRLSKREFEEPDGNSTNIAADGPKKLCMHWVEDEHNLCTGFDHQSLPSMDKNKKMYLQHVEAFPPTIQKLNGIPVKVSQVQVQMLEYDRPIDGTATNNWREVFEAMVMKYSGWANSHNKGSRRKLAKDRQFEGGFDPRVETTLFYHLERGSMTVQKDGTIILDSLEESWLYWANRFGRALLGYLSA